MSKTAFIDRRKNRFTQISNDFIRNRELSAQARFLLTLMLSHSTDFKISVRGLAADACMNKDTVSKYLNELISAGYVYKETIKIDGKFKGVKYHYSDYKEDISEFLPCPKFSDTEISDTEISDNKNTIYIKEQSKVIKDDSFNNSINYDTTKLNDKQKTAMKQLNSIGFSSIEILTIINNEMQLKAWFKWKYSKMSANMPKTMYNYSFEAMTNQHKQNSFKKYLKAQINDKQNNKCIQ